MESHSTGLPNTGGVGYNWRFWPISLYLRNGARWDMVTVEGNSYALYQMGLFPVTPNYPKPPHFPHFESPLVFASVHFCTAVQQLTRS